MQNDLVAVLFGFSQSIAFGERRSKHPADLDAAFQELAANSSVTAQMVLGWPAEAREGLLEILKAWIVAMELASVTEPPSARPSGLLAGSSSTQLGPKVVAEILRLEGEVRSLHQRIAEAQRTR